MRRPAGALWGLPSDPTLPYKLLRRLNTEKSFLPNAGLTTEPAEQATIIPG
jgi:hypothetical protein